MTFQESERAVHFVNTVENCAHRMLAVVNNVKSKELNLTSLLQDARTLSSILQQAVKIVHDFETTTFAPPPTNGSDHDIDKANYDNPIDHVSVTVNNEPIVTKELDKTLEQPTTPVIEEKSVDTSKLVFLPNAQEMRRLVAYAKCCHPDVSVTKIETNVTFDRPINDDEIRELFDVYIARYYGISSDQFYSLREPYFSHLGIVEILIRYIDGWLDFAYKSNSLIGVHWHDKNLLNDDLSNFDLTACDFSDVPKLTKIKLSNANLSLATIKTKYTKQLITFGDICQVVDFNKPEGRTCHLVIDNLGQKVVFAGCFWDTLDEFERQADYYYPQDPIEAYKKEIAWARSLTIESLVSKSE